MGKFEVRGQAVEIWVQLHAYHTGSGSNDPFGSAPHPSAGCRHPKDVKKF
ncbi:MAG: hypothetical protein ABSA27_02580 [Terriglobales bacterium]